jgi:hypothetical protein
MATEIEDGDCPTCGWPAALVYERLYGDGSKLIAERLTSVRCTNPDCIGAND